MAHFLLCFRPQRHRSDEARQESLPRLPPVRVPEVNQASSSDSGVPLEPQRTVAYVELLKHKEEPLGLVLKGGADVNQPVFVGQLHPGGVAHKSGALEIGDHIRAINGTATDRLNQNEANSLLCNSGNVINLEVEFEVPQGSDIDSRTLKKTAQVRLRRERNGFGFTISGGQLEKRPITVSNVLVGSYPYKNGILKAGDRILKVNSNSVAKATLSEAIAFLKASDDVCIMEIEYDVTIHEGLCEYRGQLMVELLKPKGASLGLTLREPTTPGGPLVVSKLKEAGIADRCGALHVGDRLLSVNRQNLAEKSINDVYRMLRRCDLTVELEIIPSHNFTPTSTSNSLQRTAENPSDTASTHSQSHPPASVCAPSQTSALDTQSMVSFSSLATSHMVTTHPETMEVHLDADGIGFGLSLQGGATERGMLPLMITSIEEGGPAAKLGQLQVGDQVLSINGIKMAGYTLQEALKLVQEAENELDLEIMYEVRDASPPSSGTYEVQLKKTGSLNLGITINGSMTRGDTIWISSLKKGGVAYRSGMLNSGDAILSINGQSLDQCNLRDAAQILKSSGDSVVLKITKESAALPQASPSSSDTVIFSVVLPRNQSSLGITLTGSSDQPGQPVVISKIKENGIAHKTGALKVGYRILAINGESLYGKTLQEALHLLNTAGDTVTLKISKATRKYRPKHKGGSPTSKLKGHYQVAASHYDRDSFNSNGSSFHHTLGGQPNYWGPRYHHGIRRPVNAFESSDFLAEPKIGESASGYNTPDNASVVSLYPPMASNFVPYGESGQRRAVLEHSGGRIPGAELTKSAFVSPSNGAARVPRSLHWPGSYMAQGLPGAQDDDQRSLSEFSQGRGQWPPFGYNQSFDHRVPPELQYAMNQQRQGAFGAMAGGASKRDSSTDDEMSVYEPEGKIPRSRRTSLQEQSYYGHQQPHRNPRAEAGRTWGFKHGPAFKSHIPVGRVSPITPTETDKAAMSPLYQQQLLKDNLKLKADQSNPLLSTQSESELGGASPLTFNISLLTKDEHKQPRQEEDMDDQPSKKEDDHAHPALRNQLQGEDGEDDEEESAEEDGVENNCRSKVTSRSQDGESVADCDDEEVGEPPPQPPSATPSRPPSRKSSTAVFDECNGEAQPSLESAETGGSETIADGRHEAHLDVASVPDLKETIFLQDVLMDETEEIEECSSIEEPVKKPRDSPSRKHSKSSLKSAEFPGNSVNDRGSPLAQMRSYTSSPPGRSTSSHHIPPQPVNVNPIPIHLSSPHKHESDSRQKRRHDHSPTRRSTSSPLGMKGAPYGYIKNPKLPPILSEYKNTLDRADKFERAMAALAESGSSDQDSDSEPHAWMANSSLHPHEAAKVMEKMRAPPSIVKQQVFVRKTPGEVSFGFSIADGQYDKGVYVKTVKPGGPSDRGGLLQYDKIIKVNEVQLQLEHTSSSVYGLLMNLDREELVLTVSRQAQLSV